MTIFEDDHLDDEHLESEQSFHELYNNDQSLATELNLVETEHSEDEHSEVLEVKEETPDEVEEPSEEPAVDEDTKEETLKPIYISRHAGESHSRTINGQTVYFVKGSVNGIPFEVECDKQVMVEPHVAEVLQGLANK